MFGLIIHVTKAKCKLLFFCFFAVIFSPVCAFAWSYEMTDEFVVPWGDEPGEAYTDFWEFDWSIAWEEEPWYTTASDSYEQSIYIYDYNLEMKEPSIIEVNMLSGEIIEQVHAQLPKIPVSGLNIIGDQDEFIIIEGGETYLCYDYQYNLIWEIDIPWDYIEAVPRSSLYKLSDGLLGIVVTILIEDPYSHLVSTECQLWRLNTSGEIVEVVTISSQDCGFVFDISVNGEVSMGAYIDEYGGIFRWNEDGNLVRFGDGQEWEFTWYEGPVNFICAPRWRLKPHFDGSVSSFEYTEEGIRLRRYEYIPY